MAALPPADEQLKLITYNVEGIHSEGELLRKLRQAQDARRPLRVKLGLDPTAPDIHLGHTVVLRKLRVFQDLGHEVYCVVGDFTARIGDPSGRTEGRHPLTPDQIIENARTYADQVFRILDPQRTHVVMNSSWLAALDFEAVVRLAATTTVARMLERDDFAARFRNQLPVGLHEFLYPLMQGYDSVALRADSPAQISRST